MSRPPATDYPFDPTYGYHLETLRQVGVPPTPRDFAAFWQATYAEALATPLESSARKIPSPRDGIRVFEIEFNSLDGARIGGWLTVPQDGAGNRGWVVGHGYGGREAPDFNTLLLDGPAIFFCARGFHRSANPRFPDTAAWHVLHGIESRETYIHRGCAADIWCAASALLERFPDTAENLRYFGGSFGGGIGALALPWDPRFHRAFLDVPSFGNHPLRVTLPCQGSGEAVRLRHRTHPEILDVLAYFDAATAATFLQTPTLVAAALFDPAVPPPGQFAVANHLAGPSALFVRDAAHVPVADPAEEAALSSRLAEWFA